MREMVVKPGRFPFLHVSASRKAEKNEMKNAFRKTPLRYRRNLPEGTAVRSRPIPGRAGRVPVQDAPRDNERHFSSPKRTCPKPLPPALGAKISAADPFPEPDGRVKALSDGPRSQCPPPTKCFFLARRGTVTAPKGPACFRKRMDGLIKWEVWTVWERRPVKIP